MQTSAVFPAVSTPLAIVGAVQLESVTISADAMPHH
jgi:hypothetical protein